MLNNNEDLDKNLYNKDFLKKYIGYSLTIAGICVLAITLIRGVMGYYDGLYNFTETEYIETIADVEIGFLPLIEPQEISGKSPIDETIDSDPLTPEEDNLNLEIVIDVNEVIEQQIPINIQIEKVELDSEIVSSEQTSILIDGLEYSTWIAPENVVGWQHTSAQLGRAGNTVLIGHHNSLGSVFKNLKDLEVGDKIKIFSADEEFEYEVKEILILLEKGESLEVRLENAKWLWPTIDERITLVTCWPKYDNSHRLIIMALPVN